MYIDTERQKDGWTEVNIFTHGMDRARIKKACSKDFTIHIYAHIYIYTNTYIPRTWREQSSNTQHTSFTYIHTFRFDGWNKAPTTPFFLQ